MQDQIQEGITLRKGPIGTVGLHSEQISPEAIFTHGLGVQSLLDRRETRHISIFCPRGLDCESGLRNPSLREGASRTERGVALQGWTAHGTVHAKAPIFTVTEVFRQHFPWLIAVRPLLLTSRSPWAWGEPS